MSQRTSLIVYLHHDQDLANVLAPIAEFAKDASKFDHEGGEARLVFHGHLEDDQLRSLQEWVRGLPSQVLAGHAELDCNSDEPTKLLWSDVFAHREGALQAFNEGLAVFLSEARHFTHI